MINITDVSAIDKLIDFYGENCMIFFENESYSLEVFREHCVDNKIMLDIDTFDVNAQGIFLNQNCVVKVLEKNKNNRDDLNSL